MDSFISVGIPIIKYYLYRVLVYKSIDIHNRLVINLILLYENLKITKSLDIFRNIVKM